MLPEDEVKVESFRLTAGGISLHLIHIPSGLAVYGEPSDEPYLARLAELHEQLELLVNKSVISGTIPAVMAHDLPAPKFKHFERVVVVGQEPRCEQWKGEQGTVVSIDSSYVRREPSHPDQWLYIVHLPTQNSWRTFCQSDLESEGSFEPESAHLGCRPEISFDTVLEEDNDWAEGSYRLPGEFWKVVIFKKGDVDEIQFQPGKWRKPTKWEREITGVVVKFPRRAIMSREDLLGAMSHFFGYPDWAQIHGPDSMSLR